MDKQTLQTLKTERILTVNELLTLVRATKTQTADRVSSIGLTLNTSNMGNPALTKIHAEYQNSGTDGACYGALNAAFVFQD